MAYPGKQVIKEGGPDGFWNMTAFCLVVNYSFTTTVNQIKGPPPGSPVDPDRQDWARQCL